MKYHAYTREDVNAASAQQKFKVISTFAGGGGSSTGYRLAGGKVLVANEFVEEAAETYRANYPDTTVIVEDIRKLTGHDLLSAAGLSVGELDILDGSPPCFVAGTLINTKRGFIPIEQIVVGDEVLTHMNRYRPVTTIMQKEYDGVGYTIECPGAEKILCTSEHPFFVRKRTKKVSRQHKSQPEWIDAKDLTKGDLLSFGVDLNTELEYVWNGIVFQDGYNKTTKQFTKTWIENTLPIHNEDFWWIVGRWLGDGWVRHVESKTVKNRHSVIICCSKNNNELNDICEVLDRLDWKYAVREMRTAFRVVISKKELVHFMNQFGNRSYNKILPFDILHMKKTYQKALLTGYLSADGSIDAKGYHRYASTSRELIYGMTYISARVYEKISAKISKRMGRISFIEGRQVTCRDSWGTGVRSYDNSKQQSEKFDDHIWVLAKKVVQTHIKQTVYNMTVDEDETYTANNIIVHNCSAFSMAGKRDKGWDKEKKYSDGKIVKNIEDLFFDFIRVIDEIKPKVVIAENVKGLTMGEAREYYAEIQNEMEKVGYVVAAQVLNAAYFGVPQARERCFFIGVREDIADKLGINCLTVNQVFPSPSRTPVTLLDGIGDLQFDQENIEQAKEMHEKMQKLAKYEYVKMLKSEPGRKPKLDTVHPNGSYWHTIRHPWDLPASTLTQMGIQTGMQTHLHPDEDRGFTLKECVRIMSLPDDYILTGDLNQRLERVGRMVAPLQMKAIAESVYDSVLSKI